MPSQIRIAQSLFFLNALIWLVFGVFTLFGGAGFYPQQTNVFMVIGFLMFGNIGAMALSGILLGRKNKWFYFFAMFVLLINIILTVTDQFGFFDLLTLIIDLILVGILISIRKHYLSHEANS